MKFDFFIIAFTLALGWLFATFTNYDAEAKSERQYYLQTIDEDGVHWFVHMNEKEHENWSKKRYAKMSAEMQLGLKGRNK